MEEYPFVSKRQISLIWQSQIHAPKVTIVLPVYQVEKYLEECLDSILAQTFQSFEVICVNDGSKDRSLDILMEYAAHDPRITVLCQENAGLSAARNTGFLHAKGDYVYFVDSDDMVKPHALSTLYEKAEETNADIIYFNASIITEYPDLLIKIKYKEDRYLRKHTYSECMPGIEMRRLMQENDEFRYVVWAQFFRTSFLQKNRLAFFDNLRYFEDGIFSERCAVAAKITVCIPDILYTYRIRPSSIVTTSRTFLHVYGYFISGLHLSHYYIEHHLTQENPWLWNIAYEFISQAKKTYRNLSAEEQDKRFQLSEEEQALFCLFIGTPDLDPSARKLKEANLYIKKLEQQNQKLKFDLKSIRHSISFRIGRMFTWIPRKIRNIIFPRK